MPATGQRCAWPGLIGAILARWVEMGRPRTLVGVQKRVREWLLKAGLPEGIHLLHFNNLAGNDRFGDVGLQITIGRTMPRAKMVEAYAGTLTGRAPATTANHHYDKVDGAIRMSDGSGHPMKVDRHPDQLVEELRKLIAEGEVMQAKGRARETRRTAANPVQSDVWGDLVLPATFDEVLNGEVIPAGKEAEMAADGVWLDNPTDMAIFWPLAWDNAQAAKDWKRSAKAGWDFAIMGISYIAGSHRALAFTYQMPGNGQRKRRGFFDPAVVPDPKAWLEARLGPLAGFEILPPGAA